MQNALQLSKWYLEEAKLILQTVKAENKYKEAESALNWIKERQNNGMGDALGRTVAHASMRIWKLTQRAATL